MTTKFENCFLPVSGLFQAKIEGDGGDYSFLSRTVPPNEATEIIASPEPQIASMRRTYGAMTIGRSKGIGVTTGPIFDGGFSLSLTAGLSFLPGCALELAVGAAALAAGAGAFDEAVGPLEGAGVPGLGAG